MSAEAASLTTAEADGLLLAVVLDDETRQDPVPVYRRLLAESPRHLDMSSMHHDLGDVTHDSPPSVPPPLNNSR